MLPGGVTLARAAWRPAAQSPSPPPAGGAGLTLASAAAPGHCLAAPSSTPRRGEAATAGHFVFYTRDFIVQIHCKESNAFIRLK